MEYMGYLGWLLILNVLNGFLELLDQPLCSIVSYATSRLSCFSTAMMTSATSLSLQVKVKLLSEQCKEDVGHKQNEEIERNEEEIN